MRVLVTGANGLVGSAIARELVRGEHDVFCVVREGSNTELVHPEAYVVRGDFVALGEAARLVAEIRPAAIIHAAAVVSTGRPNLAASLAVNVRGTRALADAAHARGVEHWVQISSMSAHPLNRSIYGGTKFLSEEEVRSSGVPFTILRPSLVYGPRKRGIFHKFAGLMEKLPIVPLIGDGSEPVAPVHEDDLAFVVGAALALGAHGKTYQIGGPEEHWRFRDLIRAVRRMLGKGGPAIAIPLPICRLGALAGEALLPNPPVTSDNIEGLARAIPVDSSAARADFGYEPRSFEVGFRDCIEKGLLRA